MFEQLISECRDELNEGVKSRISYWASRPKMAMHKRNVEKSIREPRSRAHQKVRRDIGMSQRDIDDVAPPGGKKWYQRKIRAKKDSK